MKKCPYCAELIQDEAVICRFCQHNLPTTQNVSLIESNRLPDNNPHIITSFFFGLMLLVVFYFFSFFVYFNWTGGQDTLHIVLGIYQILLTLTFSILAYSGLNPNNRNALSILGLIFLSLIPIINWFILYWAGRGFYRIFFSGGKADSSFDYSPYRSLLHE